MVTKTTEAATYTKTSWMETCPVPEFERWFNVPEDRRWYMTHIDANLADLVAAMIAMGGLWHEHRLYTWLCNSQVQFSHPDRPSVAPSTDIAWAYLQYLRYNRRIEVVSPDYIDTPAGRCRVEIYKYRPKRNEQSGDS